MRLALVECQSNDEIVRMSDDVSAAAPSLRNVAVKRAHTAKDYKRNKKASSLYAKNIHIPQRMLQRYSALHRCHFSSVM